MNKPSLAVLSFIVLALIFLMPAAYAAHEKIPDMEHGESVTQPAPDAAAPSGKVGGGDVLFQVKSAGNVTFSHDKHVNGKGLKCTDCHDSLYITRAKDKPVTMAHMRKGQSCGECHNGEKAFSVAGNCSNCHKK